MKPQNPMRIHGAGQSARSGRVDTRLAVVVILLAAVLAAWWWLHDRSLARLQGGVPLRVGYAVEAPYAFLTPTGHVTGEGPETARKVAELLELGEPEWVLADFGSLIGQLESGRFDVIAAGMFITDERAAKVAFSRETARVMPGLLVAKGNPLGLGAYEDAVRNPEVKLAALAGSVELTALTAKGMPLERLVMVPDVTSGLALLLAGKVRGFALSQPTVQWMAAREDSRDRVEAAQGFAPPQQGEAGRVAFAFRKKDRRLRQAWDRALEIVVAGEEHRRMLREYGFSEAEVAR